MSNPGKRRQPPPGTADTTPSKRPSSASGPSPSPPAQAGAAPAGIELPIPTSALLGSWNPAFSLPNQSQFPLRTGREASPRRERAVQFQSTQRPELQPDAAAGPASSQFDSLPSMLPGFRPAGGANRVSATSSRGPSQEAGIRLSRDVGALSQGIGLLPSQPVGSQPGGGAVPSSYPFHPLNTRQVGFDSSRGTGLPPGRSSMPSPGLPTSLLHGGRAGLSSGRPIIAQPSQPPSYLLLAETRRLYARPLISFPPVGGAGLPHAFKPTGGNGLPIPMQPQGGANPQISRKSVPQTRTPVAIPPREGPDPRPSRQLMPPPQVQVCVQPRGGADSKSSRSSTPPPREPLCVPTTVEADPQLSMQFFPQASFPESAMFNTRSYPQSSKATSSQPSQVGKGRKRMDHYRFCLLRDNLALLHIAKRGQQRLAVTRPDVTTTSEAAVLAQALARVAFFINDAKDRAARLRKQFKASYGPALRDLETLTQGQYFHGPEVSRVFETHKDPTVRLFALEAKLHTLMKEVIETDAELDLYCEYVLVIDEESRELLAKAALSATHSHSTKTSREDPVTAAAQAHSNETGGTQDVEPTIPAASRGGQVASREGHPSRPAAHRSRGGCGNYFRTARDSSSGTSGAGGTQDARSTSPPITPSMQGGGRQVSTRRGHTPQSRSSRAHIDNPTEVDTQYASSGMSNLIRAALSVAAEGSSSGTSGTSGRISAASSSAARGAPSRTSGRISAASSAAS